MQTLHFNLLIFLCSDEAIFSINFYLFITKKVQKKELNIRNLKKWNNFRFIIKFNIIP